MSNRQQNINSNISFNEQMIDDIITLVERMIKKEKEHLCWLESNNAPKDFIEQSERHLNFYTQRHKEYIKYTDSLL